MQYLGLHLHEQLLSGHEFGLSPLCWEPLGAQIWEVPAWLGFFFPRAMFSYDPAASCWIKSSLVPCWSPWHGITHPFPFSSSFWIFPWGANGGFPRANLELGFLDQPFSYLHLTQDLFSCWGVFLNVPLNCFSRIIVTSCFQLIPSVISTNS